MALTYKFIYHFWKKIHEDSKNNRVVFIILKGIWQKVNVNSSTCFILIYCWHNYLKRGWSLKLLHCTKRSRERSNRKNLEWPKMSHAETGGNNFLRRIACVRGLWGVGCGEARRGWGAPRDRYRPTTPTAGAWRSTPAAADNRQLNPHLRADCRSRLYRRHRAAAMSESFFRVQDKLVDMNDERLNEFEFSSTIVLMTGRGPRKR